MKRYIIYTAIILIFILSCASTNYKSKVVGSNSSIPVNDTIRDKYEALNDYFETQIKDQSQEVIIMKERISNYMTLKLLKINDIWAIDSKGIGRKDEKFYNADDWEKLRNQNGNISLEKIENAHLQKGVCCWTPTDFKYKKILFEGLEIGKSDFEKKYFSSPNYDIYWFSQPVYYKNMEFIVFTTYKASLGGFGSTVRLIIMEKIKNKWIQSYEGKPDWHS